MSERAEGASVLEGIVARTRQHVSQMSARRPVEEVRQAAAEAPAPRPFAAALQRAGRVNVIAEHKRRSPSRGAIREDLTPEEVARGYESAGAAALSVLTDEPFFGGRLEHLVTARAATDLPVLRKDFIVDPWQVWEAREAGADAILLIVAALDDGALEALLGLAGEAGVDALVEVHDREELERAKSAGARIVGVNNRNLKTLQVSLDTARTLAPFVPDDVVKVAESGIRTGDDVRTLREVGFDAFLVGERLMGAPEPGRALAALLEESR